MKTLQKILSTEHYNSHTLSSDAFLEYARSKDKAYFAVELDVTLKNYGGLIQITLYSSNLELEKILDILPLEDIQTIEIKENKEGPREDITFFNLDIVMMNGNIIRIITNWCLWQDIRTWELVRGMLVPLYLAELQNKVMFHGGMILFQESEKVITDLIDAAGKQYPNQFHPHGGSIGDQKTLSEYASCLEIADKIGGEEIGKVPVFMKGYSHLELKIHKYQETRR